MIVHHLLKHGIMGHHIQGLFMSQSKANAKLFSVTTRHLSNIHKLLKLKDISRHSSVKHYFVSSKYSAKNDLPVQSSKGYNNYFGKKESLNKPFFAFLSLRSLISTPGPYLFYGLGGLIPFMSVPIYMKMNSAFCPTLAHAQLVYGACILSFLGGIAWGKELGDPAKSDLKSLGYTISLPLGGWVGVFAYPNILAFPIMIAGISFAGYVDLQKKEYPQWFKNLRFLLSSLVVISLTGTFAFSLLYPIVQDNDDSKNKL